MSRMYKRDSRSGYKFLLITYTGIHICGVLIINGLFQIERWCDGGGTPERESLILIVDWLKSSIFNLSQVHEEG